MGGTSQKITAFDRLSAIFEDDYMQIQAYMQKLICIPRMKSNTSRVIRRMMDIVQQQIAGASRYIKIDEKHPYAVFTIIDKMDSDTFRAKLNAQQNAGDEDAENANVNQTIAMRPGKHIPTWKELEQFLDGEASIHVHEEKREESDKQTTQPKQNKQSKTKSHIQTISFAVHAMKITQRINVHLKHRRKTYAKDVCEKIMMVNVKSRKAMQNARDVNRQQNFTTAYFVQTLMQECFCQAEISKVVNVNRTTQSNNAMQSNDAQATIRKRSQSSTKLAIGH